MGVKKKWTYDMCKEEVKKYDNMSQLKTKSVYRVILKNKWNDILTDLYEDRVKWTYDKCKEVALKYNSRESLHKNEGGAYNTIKKNNWDILDIYFPIVLWTYDKCKVEALKYKYKKDMWEKSQSAIASINRNEWYELLTHMDIIGSKIKRMIYSYEFKDNSCYIGLTYDINSRNKQHLKDINSQVFKKINENISYNLIHKTEYIDSNIASVMEGIILDDYKNNGWCILNKTKTGNLGGNTLKYDYNYCLDIAKNYKNKRDFIKNEIRLYNSIISNGYINQLYKELNWVKKELDWTYDKCKEMVIKYDDLKTFRLTEKTVIKHYIKMAG